jgi:Sulfotransferase family
MARTLRQTERRLVWILGSPRSGSTWLMNLLCINNDAVRVNEPGIGVHLGAMLDSVLPVEPAGKPAIYRLDQFRHDYKGYFLSSEWERVWRPALRVLILKRFRAQLGRVTYAVIKEPHGSHAAELLMSLLPRSRMIFLLRDGRDVIDSFLDAAEPGSWLMGNLEGFRGMGREELIRTEAYRWLWRTEAVQRAFEAHPDQLKMFVRYEELRDDPAPILARLADWLGLQPEPMLELARDTSVDQMPKQERGRGRFIREASPGLWRTNLSAEEQAIVHDILGEKLSELGYPGR